MWYDNPADLHRLEVFVQNDIDPPRGHADAAYLFAHTKYFEEPILETGRNLLSTRKAWRLCLYKLSPGYPYNGPADDPTYRGYLDWSAALSEKPENNKILAIESPRPASPEEKFPVSHTGTEAEGFIKLAAERGWTAVYSVAHYIHILRAFTLTCTFVVRNGLKIKVYAKAARPAQPWNEPVVSNQGIVTGTRLFEANDAEWDRLNKVYGNKYDPISAKELIQYIRWRDL